MKKSFSFFFALVLLVLVTLQGQAQSKIKVACVGNSITEGYGLAKTYPMVLQELLGDAYEVRNYGLGGRTLLKKGDHPYWNETKYLDALTWNPDIVIIKLGTNDSKPQNWKFKEDFEEDYRALVKSSKKLPNKPKVYLAYPLPVFKDKWGINEAIVKNEILPSVKKIARQSKVKYIDLYTPFLGQAHLTYDGIHPNDAGAALLAQEVYKALPNRKTKN